MTGPEVAALVALFFALGAAALGFVITYIVVESL